MTEIVFEVDIVDQEDAVKVIQLFQRKSKCGYGIQIQYLMRHISSASSESERQGLLKQLRILIHDFIASNFLNMKRAQPHRWDTFFSLFDIPLDLKNFKLHKLESVRDFFTVVFSFDITYWLDDRDSHAVDLSSVLEKAGYRYKGRSLRRLNATPRGKTARSDDHKKETATGKLFDKHVIFQFPFTTEEQMFFLFKFAIFYEMFSFWRDICTFKMTRSAGKDDLPHLWFLRDRKLMEVLRPIIDSLLVPKSKQLPNISRIFRYCEDDLDHITLDILYNQFLFSKLKKIEKKMMIYVLNRYRAFKG